MCFTYINYQTLDEAPLLLAFNREEFFRRPSLPPAVRSNRPRVLCGTDREAGGTWLGVNQHGLCVAVTNRQHPPPPDGARSRGKLCLELLGCRDAAEAIHLAREQLETRRYAGANYICADAERAAVVHAGETLEVVPLEPGHHLMTNCDLDDMCDERQDRAREFLAGAKISGVEPFLDFATQLCTMGPDGSGRLGVIRRGLGVGTVSSTLIVLAREPAESVYRHAEGPPDENPYEDYSASLRELLATG